jgi:hypothetical protein
MSLVEMMQALLDGKVLICTHYDTHELSLVNGMLRQVCVNPLHDNRERVPNYEAFGRPELYRIKE